MLIRRKKKTSPAAEDGPPEAAGNGRHVLFIGNSLTYGHDLPLIVQALARAAGEDFHAESVTYGGFSLDDQWSAGTALRAIASRRWNHVVLQHGPSTLPESRVELRRSAQRFAPRIRKADARPALYMVWPEHERFAYFDAVRDSYSLAAADIDGTFIPAGEAWRAAWRRDPDAPLYGYDGFHPSVAGAYAAALSIYGMLCGRAPQGLPARLELAGGGAVQIPQALATLLQDAATEANQTYGRP
ncbi:MAG TPA: SGNH/GDSL hydrolase family protein [Thermoanaerobaculia bacterium]|jgi:hypothetical protein